MGDKVFNTEENKLGYLLFHDLTYIANWAHPCEYIFINDEDGKYIIKQDQLPPAENINLDPIWGQNIYLHKDYNNELYIRDGFCLNNLISIKINNLEWFIEKYYEKNIYLCDNNEIKLISKGFPYNILDKEREVNTLMLFNEVKEKLNTNSNFTTNINESMLNIQKLIELCQNENINLEYLEMLDNKNFSVRIDFTKNKLLKRNR